jgi:hypothetical protein
MRQAKSGVFQIDPEATEAYDLAALVAAGGTSLLMKMPDGVLAPLPDELGRALVAGSGGSREWTRRRRGREQ